MMYNSGDWVCKEKYIARYLNQFYFDNNNIHHQLKDKDHNKIVSIKPDFVAYEQGKRGIRKYYNEISIQNSDGEDKKYENTI